MCVRSLSSRRTRPFSVMICNIFNAVVYADGRSRDSSSCTCRTVHAPCCHKMRRIASSASVGRGGLLMANHYVRTHSYMSTKLFVDAVTEPAALVLRRGVHGFCWLLAYNRESSHG